MRINVQMNPGVYPESGNYKLILNKPCKSSQQNLGQTELCGSRTGASFPWNAQAVQSYPLVWTNLFVLVELFWPNDSLRPPYYHKGM